MSDETGSILALLEASRRRRSIAAEAFRATLTGLEDVHVQVEPVNADLVRSVVSGFVEECRQASAPAA